MKITPIMAAGVLGTSPQFVRVGMQQGRLPIGTAVKMSSVWTYQINPIQLARYIGITEEELKRKIGGK